MNESFRITRLRLVNFHNIGTTTMEIRGGGHLFLLGDNGSGKTTVLDAIHFVLTGGRSMEFNSAARVVGSKTSGGRSVQGIVMRYNIETHGPMNQNGGTTYAALEIAMRGGRTFSIGVGVSTRSMDEAYDSWGFTFNGPVASLPLIHEEEYRRRPVTKNELKDALPPNNYFGRIGAYLDDISHRFFGGKTTYADVCQLLGTGKAYREIAARAGDYDKLFRSLLQEPSKGVFEELIRSLKTLEESKQMLDALGERRDFVNDLAAKRRAVRKLNIDSAAAQWQVHSLEWAEQRDHIDKATEKLEAEKRRHDGLELDKERLKLEEERANNRLNELKQKDSTGLVNREKDARIAHDAAKSNYKQSKNKLISAKRAATDASVELEKCTESLVKRMESYTTELQRLGKSLPFTTSGLASSLDIAARADKPEREIADLPFAELHEEARKLSNKLHGDVRDAEGKIEEFASDVAAKDAEIEKARAREEAQPNVPLFAEAKEAVRVAMLRAKPLYEGLVPSPGLRGREIAILEQIIGDSILATWIVEEDEADSLRKTLFRDFPDHSIAVPKDDDTLCEWLKRFFDLTESNPDAILILGQQLMAKNGPKTEKFLEQSIVKFRGREMPATSADPRLIGLEARREQLKREIRDLEKARDDLLREQKTAEQELKKLTAAQKTVNDLAGLLQNAPSTLQKLANGVGDARQTLVVRRLDEENAVANVQQCDDMEAQAGQTLHDIMLKLKQDGLADLERRIKDAEGKCKSIRKQADDCTADARSAKDSVARIEIQITELTRQMAESLDARDKAEAVLLSLVTPDTTLDEFVAARCGEHALSREDLQQFGEDSRLRARDHKADIRNLLSGNANQAFGFIYDDPTNKLTDRRGVDIDTVIDETKKQYDEQSSIITDDTLRLFKQIIMDELVGELQRSVIGLKSMERQISLKLKKRVFGNNRYAFSISPAEGFRAIIDTVKDYHALDPGETEADLGEFVKRHFAEILNTEVGEIPAALDYRNWFRYDLKILTANSEGQIIDRKVKGLGSGGEQAVPNYLLILMIANFLYDREKIKLPLLIFDEAFYGIDDGRRDEILAFASDLDLQLLVASPDQDGVKKNIPLSTSVFVTKDSDFNVHLTPVHWDTTPKQLDLIDQHQPSNDNLVIEPETT